MKRMLTMILALAEAMVMLTSVALAEEITLSPEVSALKQAIAAMYDQYGFTSDTVAVFTPQIIIAEDETHVLFHSYFLPSSRLGEYEAVITDAGVTLTWSHDGKDLSAWQAGDPECPCWGPAQILLYEAQGIGGKDDWIKDYYAEGEEAQDEPTSVWLELDLDLAPVADDDLSRDETRAIAKTAMMDVFGLTEEEVEELYGGMEQDVLVADDGRRFREVWFSDTFKGFSVLLNAETGEVFHIYHFAGGNG